jgi:hypothetical protein
VEYRIGLVQFLLPTVEGLYRRRPATGEFVGESRWDYREAPHAEGRFREDYNRRNAPAWADLLEGRDMAVVLDEYRELLKKYIVYR